MKQSNKTDETKIQKYIGKKPSPYIKTEERIITKIHYNTVKNMKQKTQRKNNKQENK